MNLRWRSLTAAMHWGFILFQILANFEPENSAQRKFLVGKF